MDVYSIQDLLWILGLFFAGFSGFRTGYRP